MFFIFIVIIVNKKLNPVRKTCLAFSFVAYIIFFKIQNKLSIGLEFIFSHSAPLTASKKKWAKLKVSGFFLLFYPIMPEQIQDKVKIFAGMGART